MILFPMADWKLLEITFKDEKKKKAEPLCGCTDYFIQIQN